MEARTPLIVIDSANVVGSRPDGWWRDRRGATRRLRDRLHPLADTGLSGRTVPQWCTDPPVEVLLVTEGRARGIPSSDTVTVVDAPGSGDDTIVATVEAVGGHRCLVITSDRGLRRRVTDAGAAVAGAAVLH